MRVGNRGGAGDGSEVGAGWSWTLVEVPLPKPCCVQYVSLDATLLALTGGASTTNFSLGIPNNSSFISVQLFAQGLTFSPGCTPVGVIASNGGRVLMGL